MAYINSILFVVVVYLLIRLFIFNKSYKSKIFIIITTIYLTLFHALRDPYVYPDNQSYAYAFEVVSTFSFKEALLQMNSWTFWGQGYVFLNWILALFSSRPEILFVTTSIFIVVGMMYFIYKTSYSVVLSVLLWLLYGIMFYQSLFVLRQHIACVLVLIAIYNIRRKYFSAFLMLIAVLMHYSAIVVIPFLFWQKLKLRDVFSMRYVFVGIFGILLFRLMLGFVLSYIPRFESYMDVDTDSNNIVPIIILGSLFLLHTMNKTYKLAHDEHDRDILSFMAYGVILSICVIGLPGGGRLSNYFIYIMPVAYPMLFKYNGMLLFSKITYSVLFIGLILYLFVQLFDPNNPNRAVDYQFFWDGVGYSI